MNLMYPIIERVPEDFLLFIGKAEYDSVKFLKWNNLIHLEIDNENEIIQISDLKLESDFSNDEIHRRKGKNERKRKNYFLINQIGAGIIYITNFNCYLLKVWNLNLKYEVLMQNFCYQKSNRFCL